MWNRPRLPRQRDVSRRPLYEATTEWHDVGGPDHRLVWTCSDCGTETAKEHRWATISCSGCNAILQASDYDVDPNTIDPQDPRALTADPDPDTEDDEQTTLDGLAW